MLTIYYKCCLSISTLYYNFSKPRGTPEYEHYLNSTEKPFLPQGVGKTAPYLGQDGPSSFLPHIFFQDS